MDAKSEFKKIWLLAPHVGQFESDLVQQAIESNWIAPMGKHYDEFTNALTSYYSNSYIQLTSSGTSAIHLALHALNIKQGDVVLCQTLTFAGSAFPILYQNAFPVFIDSEKETFNICCDALEEAINYYIKRNKYPKAIIAVDLYGMPANWSKLTAISKKYEIPIIEDSAEALGSQYDNAPCGILGDIGILSFNGNKIITTSSGGAIITKNELHHNSAVLLANHAKENVDYYLHNQMGYNYRMSNLLAAFGLGQFKNLTSRILSKRSIYELYKKCLSDIHFIEFNEEPKLHYSNRWLTVITIKPNEFGITPALIKSYLQKFNVESRLIWNPMHVQPVFKFAKYFGEKRVAEDLFKNGLCLPSSTSLTKGEVEFVCDLIKSCIHEKIS